MRSKPALAHAKPAIPLKTPSPSNTEHRIHRDDLLKSRKGRKTRQSQKSNLVAEVAIAGLDCSLLTPDERADFYEALSHFLPNPGSESARYAATCLRESQRAHREILTAIRSGKEAE